MYIYSMGHYWPENELTNEFFNSLDIGSEANWITERVGITSRRSVLKPEHISDLRYGKVTREQLVERGEIMTAATMNEHAWNVARERAPIVVESIDTVIGSAAVPDFDIPVNACITAAQLGMERIRGFDVNSACSTFVMQCHVMRSLIDSKMTREGAIFCADRYTTRLDYSDRKNSILFGDSAIAAAVSATAKPGSLKVIDTIVESAPSGWEHIIMPAGKNFYQNGPAVQKFAVTKTIAAAQDVLAKNNLTAKDAKWFIGHQANYRMLTSAMEKLGVPEENHLYNVVDRGNQGACGAPSVLSQYWDRYKAGDYIVIAVVGAGLTWGSMLLQKQ